MRFVFRVDASLLIGSGHVMRCLTLATSLREQGAHCHFVSRAHAGHLIELVRRRGFDVSILEAQGKVEPAIGGPAHADWLGCSWQVDAQQTRELVQSLEPDWLVVDHYALDQRWESVVLTGKVKLLVIDDLADRPHVCDLLVDQNLGRRAADYRKLVPSRCNVLAGPGYALLRSEFAILRSRSLARREDNRLGHVLVNMGGVDQPNATGEVLQVLRSCDLPASCRLSVVMGIQAPWIDEVRALASQMPWSTEVLVNVGDMAEYMAASDLAIGAAGSTAWERCCLGLPTLMVVLAANQEAGAAALQAEGAAVLLGSVAEISARLPTALQVVLQPGELARMSAVASAVVDGLGVQRVLQALEV